MNQPDGRIIGERNNAWFFLVNLFQFFERMLCAQSRLSGIAVGFLGFEVEEKWFMMWLMMHLPGFIFLLIVVIRGVYSLGLL